MLLIVGKMKWQVLIAFVVLGIGFAVKVEADTSSTNRESSITLQKGLSISKVGDLNFGEHIVEKNLTIESTNKFNLEIDDDRANSDGQWSLSMRLDPVVGPDGMKCYDCNYLFDASKMSSSIKVDGQNSFVPFISFEASNVQQAPGFGQGPTFSKKTLVNPWLKVMDSNGPAHSAEYRFVLAPGAVKIRLCNDLMQGDFTTVTHWLITEGIQ
jgi:hypothetical protein